jgi:hypothetical protein
MLARSEDRPSVGINGHAVVRKGYNVGKNGYGIENSDYSAGRRN